MSESYDPTINRIIEEARAQNRKDGFPDNDLWTARRLAAMLAFMAPRVSVGMFYSNMDWSKFQPQPEAKADNESILELPRKGEH
jgi:hypothetical protein